MIMVPSGGKCLGRPGLAAVVRFDWRPDGGARVVLYGGDVRTLDEAQAANLWVQLQIFNVREDGPAKAATLPDEPVFGVA